MPTCSDCKTGQISSVFEEKVGACADCAALLVNRGRELTRQVEELLKAREAAGQLVKLIENTNAVERDGYAASSKGFGDDQNPHKDDLLRSAWDSGWARSEMERRTGQAAAVIEWAVLNLESVEDLAKGYGQPEIAGKIGVVAEKLAGFVVVR